MNCYKIPRVDLEIAKNTLEKLSELDVDEIRLEYPWQKRCPRNLYTSVVAVAGVDGFGILFCAEVPKNKLTTTQVKPKSKVFLDDCLEVFIGVEDEVYYGFECNSTPATLDYRVFVDYESNQKAKDFMVNAKPFVDGETVSGALTDTVAEVPLCFDYDWKSGCKVESIVEDEFWYLSVFIPWKDLGFAEQPKTGTKLKGTFNRVDESVKTAKLYKKNQVPKSGLCCLLCEPEYQSFHQPSKFASFEID